MALDTGIAHYEAPEKDLYEVGEMPPLGYVPKQMYAWAIRRERHGEPDKAMLQEVVDVPELDSQDVLVLVVTSNPITLPVPMPRASSGRWATR